MPWVRCASGNVLIKTYQYHNVNFILCSYQIKPVFNLPYAFIFSLFLDALASLAFKLSQLTN